MSGLLPLDKLQALQSAELAGGDCAKPGAGLPGYNATSKVPGSLVRGGPPAPALVVCVTQGGGATQIGAAARCSPPSA